MASTAAAAAAATSNLPGLWLGELAAAVQGGLQAAMAAGHGEPRPRLLQQKQKLGGEKKASAQGAVAAGTKAAEDGGGAMSDATLCLLLDRFAPS